MNNSIHHEFFFPHSPEKIWDYLTKPELIEQWLMKNDFTPLVGCDFQFRTKPLPQMEFDGIAYCKVLELKPYTKLVYSWKGGPGTGVITLDSIVTWTLTAKDNGTELVLHHDGFRELENVLIYSAMNEGWKRNIQKILDKLNAAA